MGERYVGIDVGAETIKLVEVEVRGDQVSWQRRAVVEHHKRPGKHLLDVLEGWDWPGVRGAAVTGRLSRQVRLPRIPVKQALSAGFAFLHDDAPATLVSIGSHGFAVLEIRTNGATVFRENSRCSQGTGNFLRQLVERFELDVAEASRLASSVEEPTPLSSRCPVILKTDITHLANKGEPTARILAGLFDGVSENVHVLLKPGSSPERIALLGGVSRVPRIRANLQRFAACHGMDMMPYCKDAALYCEALGCASEAVGPDVQLPSLQELTASSAQNASSALETTPPLAGFLSSVRRMRPAVMTQHEARRPVLLGFDIGSTGAKAVAMDVESCASLWEGYVSTRGNPVGAARELARQFCEAPASRHRVMAAGATGSGREIVGSLLSICFGADRVFVFNEIAAHAEGALLFNPRVDTIFEIGGQDAKYIRLDQGRVVDAAMNEACSAGTGSFIEEQGRRFEGIEDVVHLGLEALDADHAVSLGQHCAVFMAEVIDEAVAAGIPQRSIIAGVYDSIIQNYLNRVKGNRSVGQVIFCQGMPFASDALAAAVARQTQGQVIVPPNPGTVGALGIALLAKKELELADRPELDLRRFLNAKVEKKDTFVCGSTRGCGGTGNRCRIERLTTVVEAQRKKFSWGGACSLHDSATVVSKLPDGVPDPFREHEELLSKLREDLRQSANGGRRVALTDEFLLKELFPFFATYLAELGFQLAVHTGADHRTLKRGTEQANVPYCAPMKLYHGLVGQMAEEGPDYLFLPMLRSLTRSGEEPHSVTCPVVQASADLLRQDLGPGLRSKIVSPVIDIGRGNLRSRSFVEACRNLALTLGIADDSWRTAYRQALRAQDSYKSQCLEIGRRALAFCDAHDILPIVVLGRPYTIYNKLLNSNVPAILRQQGAVPISVDCYPVRPGVPVFDDIYWAHGQRNLRAAHQIRRTDGIYAVWCSNYSCGPDSFVLHFGSYIMEGKPFTVIETDGHSGDAGTKTRIEAFLYCVREHLESLRRGIEPASAEVFGRPGSMAPNELDAIGKDKRALFDVREQGERLLIPAMGCGAEVIAASLRSQGFSAESLPIPDREALALGRRHTSGKECLPMAITLGSLLQRVQRDAGTHEKFAFFMPNSAGPCRFGVYNLLHKISLERLGWRQRVHVVSPHDTDYFAGIPGGFSALVFVGFVAADALYEAFLDVRPVEAWPGASQEIYGRYRRMLLALLEAQTADSLSLTSALLQVATGRLFGITELLRRAARELASVKSAREVPTVLVVGEIYNRLDPFANDFLVDKLMARGLRAQLAPLTEWLEYTDYLSASNGGPRGFGDQLSTRIRNRVQHLTHEAMAPFLGWPPAISVRQKLAAAAPYLRDKLETESVLTIGAPLCLWRDRRIDGAISTGPLECMPNKIAEAQLFHIAEQKGLPSLTLELNGDPVDPEVLDTFVFEIHARFRERKNAKRVSVRPPRPVSAVISP